ncbi:hypothetical protein A8990_101145 [Paenibacillus taihuensis]|uniref:Uncharacterized protein n=1 Tax=Paenibacillus taihuensis TaxID=1156355 RepID=A0A3D9SEN5_9BACL|nr:hypothetical protein A8990_101145 [Paenibacillus taihuensis]
MNILEPLFSLEKYLNGDNFLLLAPNLSIVQTFSASMLK